MKWKWKWKWIGIIRRHAQARWNAMRRILRFAFFILN
jgi:hypothetical protein